MRGCTTEQGGAEWFVDAHKKDIGRKPTTLMGNQGRKPSGPILDVPRTFVEGPDLGMSTWVMRSLPFPLLVVVRS